MPESLKQALEHQATTVALKAFEQTSIESLDQLLDRGEFLRLVGFQYEALNERRLAYDAFDRSVKLLETVAPSAQLVESLSERSYIQFLLTGEPADFCPDRERAVQIARKLKDSELLVNVLVRRAFCSDKPELMHRAMDDLQEAMAVAKAENLDIGAQAMIFNASGNLFRILKLYDRSYAAYRDAYLIWRENEDVLDYFNMLHNMIGELIPLGRWAVAERYVVEMFQVAEREGVDNDYAFFSHFNQGRLALAMSRYELAIEAFSSALGLSETTVETRFVARSRLLRAMAYFWQQDLPAAKEDLQSYAPSADEDDAEFHYYSSLTLAMETGDRGGMISAMSAWRDYEQKVRLAFLDTNTRYFTEQHERQVADYESDLLKQKIALQQLELALAEEQGRLARQSNLMLGLAALILVGLVVLLGYLLHKHSKRAYTDFLTGIANRARIFERGQTLFQRAHRRGHPLAVLLIDIDHFKRVNDRFGHDVGDKALQSTVDAIEACLRSNELLGRLGGEEFIVILPGHDVQKAWTRGEEIRSAVKETAGFTHRGGQSVLFTVSLGVAAGPTMGNFQDLLNCADSALYQAKATGRDRVCVYEASHSTGESVAGLRKRARDPEQKV